MIAAWWHGRDERERRVLGVGAVVAAALLGWAFVWHPLALARTRLDAEVAVDRANLAWMRAAAGEITALRSQGARGQVDRQGKSLLALADASARGAGLAAALKRVEPAGAKSVRVTFDGASFDALIGWADALARDYGIATTDLSADKVEGLGLANVRIVLEEP